MSARDLQQMLKVAIATEVLPPSATLPEQDSRPWPVVLLTALGAWLAAIPLLGAVGLMLGDLISRGIGTYIVGGLVLAGALVVLRSRSVALFIEQLAVPALLVGGGTLAFGLFRDLPDQAAAAFLAVLALGFGWGIPRPWLRVLLGAAAAMLTTLAWLNIELLDDGRGGLMRVGVALHLSFAVWLAVSWVQRRVLVDGDGARAAAVLESLGAGWLLAAIAGLAWWSGMSFLIAGSLGGGVAGEIANELGARAPGWGATMLQALSLLLAIAAAGWIGRAWPTLRAPWCAGVAAVLIGLSWFMPALGAVMLALAVCAASGRWRLATAAALGTAWIVGSFYYQLQLPLATKATILVAAAAILGVLAWRAPGPVFSGGAQQKTPALGRVRQIGIGLTALAVLAVANIGIWQKEALINNGQPVYLDLAPVDPRSLMQGDFMRLNFRVPAAVQAQLDGLLSAERPRVVVQLDERRVASVLRLDTGGQLGAGEMRIELTPKNGRWIFVSDAWFFREGEGERWAKARFGEFRVAGDGKALLVGMVGPDLEPL